LGRLRLKDYFNSTSAPAASKAAFIFSASSLDSPSLRVAGALSTRSFASFNPTPIRDLTSFTTCSFAPPAELSTTSNSVFSAPASPPPAPGAAATATAAAAIVHK